MLLPPGRDKLLSLGIKIPWSLKICGPFDERIKTGAGKERNNLTNAERVEQPIQGITFINVGSFATTNWNLFRTD